MAQHRFCQTRFIVRIETGSSHATLTAHHFSWKAIAKTNPPWLQKAGVWVAKLLDQPADTQGLPSALVIVVTLEARKALQQKEYSQWKNPWRMSAFLLSYSRRLIPAMRPSCGGPVWPSKMCVAMVVSLRQPTPSTFAKIALGTL